MAVNFFFGYAEPPARVRTKPLRVICVGLPRSATESLSIALQKLGYNTFHGWDLVAQEGNHLEGWTKLAARKYGATGNMQITECNKETPLITRAEFDALLGDHDAIIDSAASIFCPEIVAAYPDAQIILNSRADLAAWQRSVVRTIVPLQESWFLWIMRWFSAEMWWLWHFYLKYGYPGLFRAGDNWGVRAAVVGKGKWVYQDHNNMVRGLVGRERLLEWSVEEGWGPLCEFLGHPVPDEPFPRSNDAKGFEDTVDGLLKARIQRSFRHIFLLLAAGGAVAAAAVMKLKAM
ncbi:hypothetical protein BJX64DRAFT_294729 [Aspergillus heterothallicus]